MEQNTHYEDEVTISIADIVRMFRGKLRKIIAIAIVAGIIGGLIGIISSVTSMTYGTTLKYRLNPTDGGTTLMYVLKSGGYSEYLLLDENGLPPKEDCDPALYQAALDAAEAYKATRAEKKAASEALETLDFELGMADLEYEYSYMNTEYNRVYGQLQMYKDAYADSLVDENHLATIAKLEAKLDELEAKRSEFEINKYRPTQLVRMAANQRLEEASLANYYARLDYNEAAEAAREQWREKEEVKELIDIIDKSVKYEYTKLFDDEELESSTSTSDDPNKENLNRSFITITVAVENSKDDAELIVSSLKKSFPTYIDRYIEQNSGALRIECTNITPFAAAKLLDVGGLIKGAITTCVLVVVLAVIAYCAWVVFKNIAFPNESKGRRRTTK